MLLIPRDLIRINQVDRFKSLKQDRSILIGTFQLLHHRSISQEGLLRFKRKVILIRGVNQKATLLSTRNLTILVLLRQLQLLQLSVALKIFAFKAVS